MNDGDREDVIAPTLDRGAEARGGRRIYEPGARVQNVADRFEVSPAQICGWRRNGLGRPAERPTVASFAREEVAETAASHIAAWPRSSMIEIRLGHDTMIVVGEDVNEGALRGVLVALGR